MVLVEGILRSLQGIKLRVCVRDRTKHIRTTHARAVAWTKAAPTLRRPGEAGCTNQIETKRVTMTWYSSATQGTGIHGISSVTPGYKSLEFKKKCAVHLCLWAHSLMLRTKLIIQVYFHKTWYKIYIFYIGI